MENSTPASASSEPYRLLMPATRTHSGEAFRSRTCSKLSMISKTQRDLIAGGQLLPAVVGGDPDPRSCTPEFRQRKFPTGFKADETAGRTVPTPRFRGGKVPGRRRERAQRSEPRARPAFAPKALRRGLAVALAEAEASRRSGSRESVSGSPRRRPGYVAAGLWRGLAGALAKADERRSPSGKTGPLLDVPVPHDRHPESIGLEAGEGCRESTVSQLRAQREPRHACERQF